MQRPNDGIKVLKKLFSIPGVNHKLMANAKLLLGDALLMTGEPWEADLLYKQVEKDYTNDALGQEARFRYARLCYYRGDFEWAQTQLDILKGATTQLISNNAMRLWLIIQDNMGLDSTYEPLEMYAKADLLIYSNRLDDAEKLLDSIPIRFPGHTLNDEILFSRARIAEKQKDYLKAEKMYLEIIKVYSFDILTDNALFNLAQLYETHLNSPEKAKEMYKVLVLDFTGSVYSSDARKKYREMMSEEEKFFNNIEP